MTSVTLLLPLFLLLLLLPTIPVIAQTYRNISLGSSLTAVGDNTSWPSPAGDFAFGFRPLDRDLFLLAIWFDKIPDKTIVWYANGDKPAPKGSKVELTTDGKLVLNDPQGKELWEAGPVNGAVSYAAMLDNGNFILASRNSSGYSWESFKNPTDTILPTQTMEVNSMLYSRQTENTYSRGRFRLNLLENGNLVLNIVAFPSLTEVQYDAYYGSNTANDDNRINAGYQVVFNQSGYISVLIRNGSTVNLSSLNIIPTTDIYYRATLDFDGVFTQYSHPRRSRDNKGWSKVWSVPDNICVAIGGGLGSGACGYNSYCLLTSELRPRCECPPEFVFVDPNNRYGGCRPDFIQGCQLEEWRTKENSFELETLEDIDWPTSDYERLESYSEEQCRTSCLNDCLCDVAIVRAGNCWKKKLPLSNGRYSSTMNGKALIKVRKDNSTQLDPCFPPNSGEKKDRSTLILVGSLLLGSSVFFNFLLLAAISLVFFLKENKKLRKNYQEQSVLRSNLRSFTYQELEEATGGFKEELGRGAFGIVYKGVIGEMGLKSYIAVKKLDKVVQEGEKEFKTEVSIIGQTHHKNLVRLLGFCEEGENRLLVYEFMNNGSLAERLFGISKLDWNRRVQIAFGIARGLLYLHEECSTQIIHCDIKPQNILLDDCFTAKISDFGLAKLLMNEQTRTRTGIRGTRGYVAPEWFRRTPITVKVDVYSFGVMLLEIICCRKSVELELGGEEKALLTDWVYDSYIAGKLRDLVENDEDAMNDMRRLERLVMIAIWCIQEEPSFRPSMKKVTQMLEGVLDVPVPPCPYPFSQSSGNHPQL
ncbi:Protein kinase domain [Macleaya cordata]|uniref:Receptor-like serine/threonine-protein kinase n=1 Tax=Macleaya cordata TaxID=56857 RepID=A0A200PZL8_MACCD|nr:Protein kinase domain [Macleaya cordata]